ncbi:hypothetical protein Hte_011747 [Hypoxylon texense]
MDYQQGNVNNGTGAAFAREYFQLYTIAFFNRLIKIAAGFISSRASMPNHFPTGKAFEKQAKATVENYHQNGMSLASLWTDADTAADIKHLNKGEQKYLSYIRQLVVQKIIDDLEMKSAGALEPTQAGTHGMLGMLATHKSSALAQAAKDGSPKLNPKAEVFTPTATRTTLTKRTPSTDSINITTTGALSFEERCQKLGLRVSPAPPKKPAKSNIKSTLDPTALNFEQRCKMIGLRVSPQKH